MIVARYLDNVTGSTLHLYHLSDVSSTHDIAVTVNANFGFDLIVAHCCITL